MENGQGTKKEHEFVFSSLLLHMFALKPEHRKQLFKKKKGFTAVGIAV